MQWMYKIILIYAAFSLAGCMGDVSLEELLQNSELQMSQNGEEQSDVELINISEEDQTDSTPLNTNTLKEKDIIINEVLADPPDDLAGDANGDGIRNSYDDEFIELVNTTGNIISLDGLVVAVGGEDKIKHTFKNGDVIEAGRAIVLFGGGQVNSGYGTSKGFVSDTSLRLSNSGGAIYLILNNVTVDSINYPSADNESLTRYPDITGELTPHLKANIDKSYSPGTKSSGEAF